MSNILVAGGVSVALLVVAFNSAIHKIEEGKCLLKCLLFSGRFFYVTLTQNNNSVDDVVTRISVSPYFRESFSLMAKSCAKLVANMWALLLLDLHVFLSRCLCC